MGNSKSSTAKEATGISFLGNNTLLVSQNFYNFLNYWGLCATTQFKTFSRERALNSATKKSYSILKSEQIEFM